MKRQAKAIVAISAMLLTFALGASSAAADTPPAVTIDAASQVGVTGAHLSGTVDPEGGPSTTYWRFEVAPADEPENWIYAFGGEISPPDSEGTSPIVVEGNAESLQPNREYIVRLVAENQDFVNRTETEAPRPSFTTDVATAPVLTVGTATDVSYTTAHLAGTVDPEGGNVNPATGPLPIYVNFEVSTDGGGSWSFAGSKELTGTEAESTSPVAVELDATGLAHGQPHQFRLVASYASFNGQVESAPSAGFVTLAVAKPTIALDPVTAITPDSAHLSGSVDPNGTDPAFDSSCLFEYITDAAYQPRDELQRVQVKANGGTFTLELDGQITAPIAYNASAATVQAALEALSNLDPGDVSVSGGPGNLNGTSPYLVTFIDADAPGLGVDHTGLLAPGKAQVSTFVEGFPGQSEIQRLTVAATDGTYTLSFTLGASTQTTAPIAFDADAATVQAALEGLASIAPGDVVVSGGPGDPSGSSPYSIAFAGALANANQKPLTSNTSGLPGLGAGEGTTVTQGRDEGFSGAPQVPCLPGEEKVKGSGAQPVQVDLKELEPGTTYHVRLLAENAAGVSTAGGTFKTISLSSTAITHLVGNLQPTSARLTGLIDPQSEPTTYYFEWGTQPDLSGAQSVPPTEDASAGSGDRQIAVGDDLDGLAPGTTYYYRLVSDNPTGPPAVGQIRSFTTRATPPPTGKGVGAYGDRVIEHVNAPDLSGGPVNTAGPMSEDGNRVIYRLLSGSHDTEFGQFSAVGARRTSSGWVSWNAQPPRSAVAYDNVVSYAASSDLSQILYLAGPSFGESGESQFLTYGPFDGVLKENGISDGGGRLYIGSEDLTHFFFQANGSLDPSDPSTIGGLYDYATNPPQLVSFLPDEVAPTCGVRQIGGMGDFPFSGQSSAHWASDDGRRLFFHSRGSGDCDNTPSQLYMREAGPSGSLAAGTGATTTLISGPVLSGDDVGADPVGPLQLNGFVRATPDGSSVIFKTEQVLDTDDLNSTKDLYRFTVGKGNECITCFAPQVQPEVPLVSEDLSHVYFRSRRALAPGGVAGQPNLYMWRADSPGGVQFVAPDGEPSLTNPDGSTFLFQLPYDSRTSPLLDALTGNDSSPGSCESAGCNPLYRYDEAERSITCVSCRAGGSSPAVDAGYYGEDTPNLSSDGEIFIFTTPQALVPEDVNAGIDAYEWRQGKVGLITDGITPEPGGRARNANLYNGISPDGRDVLVISPSKLHPSVAETTAQLYDARIGGGFPNPEPPAPCGGDLCQGAPTPPPPTDSSGTSQFSGPGNQAKKPTTKCNKGKVRKRGSCVKKSKLKKRSKKQSKKANANRGGGK